MHPGQTAEELVRDILPEPGLAKLAAFDVDARAAKPTRLVGPLAPVLPDELERSRVDFVNLAAVVSEARDLEPVPVWVDHAPPHEIVYGSAPQHGLLAARVHRNVAADARSIRRRRIHREHEARLLGRIRNATRHDTGFAENRGRQIFLPRGAGIGQRPHLHFAQCFQLLGVDHGRQRRERHRAARVTRAAAARDNRQSELDARAHERRDLVFRIGRQNEKRILDAPVRRVGHVRDAREGIEANVVLARIAHEQAARALAQVDRALELALERLNRRASGLQQLADLAVAIGIGCVATTLHFVQAVHQPFDQHAATLRVVDEVVLKVGVASYDPDVAEHFVEHACGAAGAALAAQLVENPPDRLAEQTYDDLAIRERRVVVRNFTQPRGRFRNERALRLDRLERKRQIEQGVDLS